MRRTTVMAAGLALAVSAGCGGCGSGHGGSAPGARASPQTATPRTGPATAVSRALGDHGELAFVARGSLFLAGGPAGVLRRVSLPGLPDGPAWSADHRWLAVEVSKPPPTGNPYYQPDPAALWVVSAAGTGARRLTPARWDITSFAWSPRSGLLAVAVSLPAAPAGRAAAVATLTPGGARKILAAGGYVSGVAWSPGGGQIAAGVCVHVGRPGCQSRLELLNPAGGQPQVAAASPGNLLELAGWRPDGSGLFFWLDPGASASLAADGLPLDTVSLHGKGSRQLAAAMLVHGSWLAFSPGGHAAVVSGGYREIWSGHKRITICHPAGGCTPVTQPAGVVSLQPSWSPDGKRLVFTRASAAGPFGPDGRAGFSPYWIRRWQTTSRLWLASADGSRPRPLTVAGPGALDPVWGSDGSLLFIRDDWLWLLPSGAASPTRVAGPLGALAGQAYDQTYYGYVAYPELAAWTLAQPFATAGSS